MKAAIKNKLDEVVKDVELIDEAYHINPREEITQIKKSLVGILELIKLMGDL